MKGPGKGYTGGSRGDEQGDTGRDRRRDPDPWGVGGYGIKRWMSMSVWREREGLGLDTVKRNGILKCFFSGETGVKERGGEEERSSCCHLAKSGRVRVRSTERISRDRWMSTGHRVEHTEGEWTDGPPGRTLKENGLKRYRQ